MFKLFMIYNNINLRKQLSDNARNDYDKRFSVKRMDDDWNYIFNKVIKFPKTTKKWSINKKKINGKDVFLESLGSFGETFCCDIKIKKLGREERWQTTSKGTVYNYLSHFPNNPALKKWSKLMKEEL